MLELVDLDVRYGSVAAVRDLSLHVERGEIVGLIGPNGAGKSTTLHAIMGMVPTHSGEIRLAGELAAAARLPRSSRAPASRSCRRAGASSPELTVEENLRLGLAGRHERDGARRRPRVVYELFPIVKEFRRRQAGALSGGQQQQLAIGRALVARPKVLLLDEPSLGLAPKIVDVVFEALAEIRSRGVTVLLVEQRAQRTVEFSDRTYLLANGEIRLTLTPADASDTRDDGRRLPLVTPFLAPPLASLSTQVVVDAIGLGRDLRADGRRHRPRLRRAPARELRLRTAGHGGRVHARLHLELARRLEHRRLRRSWSSRSRCDGGQRSSDRCAAHSPTVMLVTTFAISFVLQAVALIVDLRDGQIGEPVASVAAAELRDHDRRRVRAQGDARRRSPSRSSRSACWRC